MALLVKQFVTRSAALYRPAVATGRFLSIKAARECDRCFDSRGFNGCHDDRGLTTKTFYEAFMNRFPRVKRELSRVYSLVTDQELSTATRMWPIRMKEDAECLMVDICLSTEGPENMRISVDHNTVFVNARSYRRKETFICWFDLPDIDSTTKIYKASDIKAVLRVQQGWLQLIIPKLKKEELEYTLDVKTITEDED